MHVSRTLFLYGGHANPANKYGVMRERVRGNDLNVMERFEGGGKDYGSIVENAPDKL